MRRELPIKLQRDSNNKQELPFKFGIKVNSCDIHMIKILSIIKINNLLIIRNWEIENKVWNTIISQLIKSIIMLTSDDEIFAVNLLHMTIEVSYNCRENIRRGNKLS